MRRFSYKCDKCGDMTQIFLRPGEKIPQWKKCRRCGKFAERIFMPPGTPPLKGWPLLCESVGVMPDQIPEARRADAYNGVRCDFTPDGRRIFQNRAHMRDWLKANQMHNRDGGYGDG